MSLYLCVDCGGSKTSAVIANSAGEIIGRGIGGPSNCTYLTVDAFLSAITVAISEALKTCSSPPSVDPLPLPPPSELAFAKVWFGVSGADSPAAIAAITPGISKLLGIPEGPRLAVANDTHLLAAPLRMHHDVGHAVAVIGGTGSIAVSFSGDASGALTELGRIGGWGWILGDEGGGYDVGREAVRQVMLAHDRASVMASPAKSMLHDKLVERFALGDIMEILGTVHLADPVANAAVAADTPHYLTVPREKRLSSLAPIVFECAFQHGDALAMSVLRTSVGKLADEIAVLLGDATDAAPRLIKAKDSVVCFGGSLVGIEAYRKLLLDDLASRGHAFRYVEFVDDCAAVGARALAMAGKS
ncbi:hypothetical protein BD626DRAFT_473043 [Schizophyllum amplum]|uniref:N-acetyl-D-glucosamine kinase n=1 Tax=Schizophyllum amplum TaxID=97359 RepID=A0A550CWG7_9AGAR|nr:hypothetical protein BD626DRAFT_473043 [Auriculariopsis ampla]